MANYVVELLVTLWLVGVLMNSIDFIRFRDVQLTAFRYLLKVCTLVEGTAQTCLPYGGVCFVSPLSIFALVYGPGLRQEIIMELVGLLLK